MKHSVILVVAGIAMLFVGAGLSLSADSVQAQVATTFAVDGDPSTGTVDAAVPGPVTVGNTFHVNVVLTDLETGDDYDTYQATVQYETSVLEAVGAPASWGLAPTATEGGNLAPFTAAACDPAIASEAFSDQPDGAGGIDTVQVTCFDAVGGATTFEGALVQFVFQCIDNGTVPIDLLGTGQTFVLNALGSGVEQSDGSTDASVVCGTGVNPTPTATNTPAATNTPCTTCATSTTGPDETATNTPSPTRTPPPDAVQITPTPRAGTTGGGGAPPPGGPAPTQPGGRPGGVIGGPDTGTGDGGASDPPYALLLLAAGLIFVAAGMTPAGARVLTRTRRTRGG
jgi:hypothetical protein